MAQKRYGPILAPGVGVIETEAGKAIQAAPFGVTGFVGVLEKGEVGKLISCYSLRDFKRKCGGRIDASLVPDAAEDFWNHGEGTGELHLLRVTDGTEVQAHVDLWSRQTDLAGGYGRPNAVVRVKAKNAGRWGGKTRTLSGLVTGGIAETALTTGITMKLNEWAGGYVKLHAVTTKQYKIVSNTTAGVVTVSSDSTMLTDAASADGAYTLELERSTTKELALIVGNGEVDADALWSLSVLVDGLVTLHYPNLSMDPTSKYYFLRLINDDGGNHEIVVEDLNTGGNYQNYRRPASYYGKTKTAGISGTTITVVPHYSYADSDETGSVTVNEATYTSAMKYRAKVKYVILAGGATMDVFASFNGKDDASPVQIADAVAIAAYAHPLLPTVTLADVTAGDVYWLEYFPFTPNGLIDSWIYPHAADATYKNTKYRIVSNAVNTVTVSQTISIGATTGDSDYYIVGPMYGSNGYDGGTPTDANYTSVNFDTTLSPFNDLLTQNKGLVRLATPGVYATSVVKAGIAFAEAKNWQFRVDIDKTVVTEDGAINFINSTIGRNDFAVTAFPSFGWVSDKDKPGQLKQVSLTGAIMGREAAVARDYGGYHKVAAGISVTLPRLVKLDTGNLNEEVLTPQGINVVKKVKGNYIVWGARTLAVDSAWKFVNHRSQMSHYEHILQENFDWTIFQINDPVLQAQVISALRGFFLPEWRNRALRGDTFEEACTIKVDNEINTDLTRAAGELWAEINLQLADTVERFIIRMSKDGVFEQAA